MGVESLGSRESLRFGVSLIFHAMSQLNVSFVAESIDDIVVVLWGCIFGKV